MLVNKEPDGTFPIPP